MDDIIITAKWNTVDSQNNHFVIDETIISVHTDTSNW